MVLLGDGHQRHRLIPGSRRSVTGHVLGELRDPDFDARHRHARAGGVGEALRVVHGDDFAAAIVDHVRDRDGALLVLSNSGTGLVSQRRGGVSAHVVSELDNPVLLIGPAVPDPVPLGLTTLVPSTVANDAPSQMSSIHLSASA